MCPKVVAIFSLGMPHGTRNRLQERHRVSIMREHSNRRHVCRSDLHVGYFFAPASKLTPHLNFPILQIPSCPA